MKPRTFPGLTTFIFLAVSIAFVMTSSLDHNLAFGIVMVIWIIAWHVMRYRRTSRTAGALLTASEAREWELPRPKWLMVPIYGGGALFLLGGWMFDVAFQHNPHHADPASGHIYSLANHGTYVYVTWNDAMRIYGTMLGGWAIGAVAMAFGLWNRPVVPRFPPPDTSSGDSSSQP
jgi:hypothetical protein